MTLGGCNFLCKSLLVVFVVAPAALCQRQPDYDNVVTLQSRIDARDLGYAPIDTIPDGESGITSLTLAPDGYVFGATSGVHSHLFVLIPRHGFVQPLGVIPDATAVTNAVVVSQAGDVYVGSSPQGHLLKYVPGDVFHQGIKIGQPLPVTDLGQAVAGESIAAMTIDRRAGQIYGLTFPNAHFFEFSIGTSKVTDLGVVAQTVPTGEKFEHDKMMSRMLVVAPNGNVYCSGQNGAIYEFNPNSQKLRELPIHAPAVPGREQWTRVDAFLLDPEGTIYGGTSDGYLFRLDPDKPAITNLGKPLNQYRIVGLASGPNGKLYGVGGDKEEISRLFSYNPATGAYDVLGFIDVNRRPYYTWQAYFIGAVISDHEGTVYLGEDERISKLYLYYPY